MFVRMYVKKAAETTFVRKKHAKNVDEIDGRWPAVNAFTFEFFRDIYEDLDSPVLYNEDSDCQFFAWEFAEFSHLQQVPKKIRPF